MAATTLIVKWGKEEHAVELAGVETVAELKRALQERTHVDCKRQKLLGLKTRDGKLATDDARVADLAIKPNTKVRVRCCCWLLVVVVVVVVVVEFIFSPRKVGFR